MTMDPSDLAPSSRAEGRMIADRYLIERLSQEDATTLTMTARHLSLDELVDVKFLRPELRLEARASARFSSATKALARIKTDHVVRVLDVGTALSVGPYLVLEHLEGSTLAELLRAEGKLPVARAVDYVLQACKGLAVAHAAGIVHRSVQPSSLFVARRGEFEILKVVDFSTADDSFEAAHSQHLAPEVILANPAVDQRADVWSLGTVLYELVTGRLVFTHDQERGVPLAEDLALSPSLRKIIARCLQPDCSLRFQSVDELAAELLPLTTMNEVFRGSLTGSFSRQMFLAAAAQARASAASAPRVRQRSWRERLVAGVQGSLPAVAWGRRGARLPRVALEQCAVVVGTAAVVALGMAMGDLTLVPPPPVKHASATGAPGEPAALVAEAVAVTPPEVAPAEVAPPEVAPPEVAPPEVTQRTWALQPEPPPVELPKQPARVEPSRAHGKKLRGKKAASAVRASRRRTVVRPAQAATAPSVPPRR